jgi:hypothetical protein
VSSDIGRTQKNLRNRVKRSEYFQQHLILPLVLIKFFCGSSIQYCHVILISLTVNGFWIEHRIYWTLHTARDYTLQFTISYTETVVHSHVFTSRCSVVASNTERSTSFGLSNDQQHHLPVSHNNWAATVLSLIHKAAANWPCF